MFFVVPVLEEETREADLISCPYRFHWEIMVSEKSERHSAVPGIRYRVKPHLTQGWVFEKVHVADVKNVPGLLARILVADIVDADLVDRIVCTTPLVLGDREWRCYDWVKDVLSKLAAAEDRAVLPAVAAGVEGYVAVMKPAEGVAGDDGATTGTGTTVNAVDGGATDTVEGAAAGDAPTGDGIAPDDGAAVVADGDFIAEKDAGSMDVQLGEPTDQDEIVYISVFTELDWDTIKAVARRYVEDKIVAGRYTCFEDIEKPRPTYCMITSQEYWV